MGEHEIIALVFESDGGTAFCSLDRPEVSSLRTTLSVFVGELEWVFRLRILTLICVTTGLIEPVDVEMWGLSHLSIRDFISADTQAASTLFVAHRYLSPEEVALARNARLLFFDLL
jgi:hypothetical protein